MTLGDFLDYEARSPLAIWAMEPLIFTIFHCPELRLSPAPALGSKKMAWAFA
ncbi:hypothetical protein NHQ30_009141 [Ciborinia camelliae]|nr:hypothetical protein NHQ30_009141 [Ciborinia camelliae]